MRFLKAQLDVDMEQESKATRERQTERCTFREARGRGGNYCGSREEKEMNR